MATIKISQLPRITNISSNTANVIMLVVDTVAGITSAISDQTLAAGLYVNNPLNVGNNTNVFPNTVAQISGTSNNYVQVNLENINNDNGTADFVVTANTGADVNYYIDMGYANKNYIPGSFNGLGTALAPLDGYIYVQGLTGNPGGNLVVGTTTTGTHYSVVVGGSNTNNVILTANATALISLKDFLVTGNVVTTSGVVFPDGSVQVTASQGILFSQGAFAQANIASNNAQAAFNQANTAANNASYAISYFQPAYDSANSSANAIVGLAANSASFSNVAASAYNAANNALGNIGNIYIQLNINTNNATLALSTAQTSFILANNAAIQANNALNLTANTANTALGLATYAANTANLAILLTANTANLALSTANTAYNLATYAASTANNALNLTANTANLALITANNASNNAQLSLNAANNLGLAWNTANTANATGNGLANTTQIIFNIANTHTNNIILAWNTANNAANLSQLSFNTANTASNNAQLAFNAANTVTAAFTVANTASNNATAAFTVANTASNNATGAFATANQATNTSLVAVNIRNGAANQIAYQTGSNTTSFITAPANTLTILTWNANNGGFLWSTGANLNTNFANVSNISLLAVNMQGGAANQIMYQTAANTGAFITAPTTNNYILSWSTSGGFVWVAGTNGGNANYANIANITLLSVSQQGGLANQISYQTAANVTSFIAAPTITNGVLTWSATAGGIIWQSSGNLNSNFANTANLAVALQSGAANQIPYQTGSSTTSYVNAPVTSGSVLTWNSNAGGIQWVPAACSSVYISTFTANGTTNAWALTSPNIGTTLAQVFVNGVYQTSTSYTLSGNTVTLTENPYNGASVEIVSYQQMGLNGNVNTSNVVATGTVTATKGYIGGLRLIASNPATINVDFSSDAIIKTSISGAYTFAFTNYIAGKSVEIWITNTAAANQTATLNVSTNLNSTSNSTTYTHPTQSTIKYQYVSMFNDFANTFVAVTHS